MRKPTLCIGENIADHCAVTAQPISALVFAAQNFQASNYLLFLYRPVCVRPGRRYSEDRFSHDEAHILQHT